VGLGNYPDALLAMYAYRRAGLAPAENLHAGILKKYGAYDIIHSENLKFDGGIV